MDEQTRKVLHSSSKTDYGTPQYLFDLMDKEFGPFTLDAAANSENAKCDKFYSIEDDGLSKSWVGETVFVNWPYGRKYNLKWAQKIYKEAMLDKKCKKVALVAARIDTVWFSEYLAFAEDIYFLKGRVTFDGADNNAAFPSCIVVFDPERRDKPRRVQWITKEFDEIW
jgi:site-specific DNA-methyltransferase (adenine-specific)